MVPQIAACAGQRPSGELHVGGGRRGERLDRVSAAYRDSHTVFLGLSSLGFVWAALFYWWFHDRPEEHRAVNVEELQVIREERKEAARGDMPLEVASEKVALRKSTTPWRALFTSWPMFLICAQQFFRSRLHLLRYVVSDVPAADAQRHDENSGYLAGLPLAGVVAGSLMGGLLSDAIYRHTGSLASTARDWRSPVSRAARCSCCWRPSSPTRCWPRR